MTRMPKTSLGTSQKLNWELKWSTRKTKPDEQDGPWTRSMVSSSDNISTKILNTVKWRFAPNDTRSPYLSENEEYIVLIQRVKKSNQWKYDIKRAAISNLGIDIW